MKRVKGWFGENWRVLVGILTSAVFIIFLYSFHINSLTGGLSGIEKTYTTENSYIQNVIKQPVFIIHKLLSYIASSVSDNNILSRLPSVILILVITACFYALVSRWYTRRVALLTSLLFVTSSWTLTIGRQALPTTMYLTWLPVLALMYWSVSSSRLKLSLILWSVCFGLALYTPGIMWFVLVLAASQRKRLQNLIKNAAPIQLVICAVLLILLAVPYFITLFTSPVTAISALGLPASLTQITSAPERLYQIVLQVFIYSTTSPIFHLGHLPYLDITTSILFLIGICRLRYSQARKMMAWSGAVTIGWLVGISLGAINIAVLLPLIYMFVGGGISFLLIQWFKVFPRNPFARGFGLVVVGSLVILISFYHLSRYFIAWPLNPATKEAFSVSDVKISR
jgi:hypothetical protein